MCFLCEYDTLANNTLSLSSLSSVSLQVKTSGLHVNIQAEETLVLVLAVLCDHKDVLLCDQILDAVADQFGCLYSLLHTCAHTLIQDDLLDNLVNNVGLRDRLLAFTFELLQDADDELRVSHVLLIGDLRLFRLRSWLLVSHLI